MNSTELRILRATIKAFPAIVLYLKGRARWVAFSVSLSETIWINSKYVHQNVLREWFGYDTANKSYDYFLQQLERLVRSVYDGNLGGEFMDILANLISGQLTDAYQTAIDEAGLSPDEVTEDMKQQLDDFINAEYDHTQDYYQAVVDARVDGTPIEPLLSRAELWAGRWNDVHTAAALEISKELGENMEWVEGDTEHKCDICQALDGIVAGANEWDELGVRPQSPPNQALDPVNGGCGGWKCQCELKPTDKRRSPRAYDRIVEIVSGGA